MLIIIKNNWYRLMEEKLYVFISCMLTFMAVGAAIVLTNQVQSKINIAVVSDENLAQELKTDNMNITELTKTPLISVLIQNRYDAVIQKDKNGAYEIITLKNQEFQNQLKEWITNPNKEVFFHQEKRQIGTNIIGYMMMFVLMQGVLYGRLFAEDKEKHMIERIAISPIAFRNYLIGHGIFMWLLGFIPNYAILVFASLIKIPIGFTLVQYGIILGMLTILSTTFALFIHSLFCVMDTANMLGNIIILLSSILGGSFYSYTRKDSILSKILTLLPQKSFLHFVDSWEKGSMSTHTILQVSYVILISMVMLFLAIRKTQKEYAIKTR